MTPEALRRILESVSAGDLPVEEAVDQLRHLPEEALDEVTLDRHRELRCGFPEVIYGEGKTVGQILAVADRLVVSGSALLATRLHAEALAALEDKYPDGHASAMARVFHRQGAHPLPPAAEVAVVSAGTSDQPVAEEAAITAEAMGVPVRRVRDAGVAGIHRLLRHQALLREAAAVIVVAGMEGALPSVVGGLTDRPVFAVPTSVGYGAHFGGLAPLLGMLNSCAAGVSVVNIDNGFGAGFSAALTARLAAAPLPEREPRES